MARYIKANPKVAQYLHLENDRNTVKDGNYLLWQGDMLAFGPLTQLPKTLQQIGGIALMPHEAREEQDGTYNRPLPVATDERFIMDAVKEPEEQPKESEVADGSTEAEAAVTEGAENDNADPEITEGTAEELLDGEGNDNKPNDEEA